MNEPRDRGKPLQPRAAAPTAENVRAAPDDRSEARTFALTIVWHPNARRVGERVILYPLATGGEVGLSRNEPDFLRPGSFAGEPLDDPFVSRKPITLSPGPQGGVILGAPAEGTHLVCGTSVVEGRVFVSAEAAARGVPLVLAGRVALLLHTLEPSAGEASTSLGMVGDSEGIRRVRLHVERVADLAVPVLIRGETGTGKELVARAVHDKSQRRAGPFTAVNLAAIPKELAAAQLFGSQKGSFTGALSNREGFFQAARGGTLFLDELGEAPPDVQAMLLRVLETGEMYPVGASTPIPVDVRLIAATDAQLEEQIREGRFKAPLLHRVAGYEIRIPPLRERREDIGPLIRHFATQELAAIGESHRLTSTDPYTEPWLPAQLAARMVTFDWSGNIRQLRNMVLRIVIGSRGQTTTAVDPQLDLELSNTPGPSAAAPAGAPPPVVQAAGVPAVPPVPVGNRRKPSEISEEEVIAALSANDWDLKAAADALGIPRPSIYDVLKRFPNIRRAGDLSADEIKQSYHEAEGDIDRMVQALRVSKRALQRRLNELGLKPRRG